MDDSSWIAVVFVAVLLGAIPANIASKKGHSFGAWWLYGFLFFAIALVHSLLIKPNTAERGPGRTCPACAETVKLEASVCRYCGRELPKLDLYTCSDCGAKFTEGTTKCPGCGVRLRY